MTIVSDSTQEMVTEIYLSTELVYIKEKKIRIFALDSNTIGLSNAPPKLWQDQRLWEGKIPVLKNNNELTIILPPEIVQFYHPKKIELASSLEKDNVILVINH